MDYKAFWKTVRRQFNNPAVTGISDGRYEAVLYFGWRENVFLFDTHAYTHRGRTLYGDWDLDFEEYLPLKKWSGFDNRGMRAPSFGADALWSYLKNPRENPINWRNIFLSQNQIGIVRGDKIMLSYLEAKWSFVQLLESSIVVELARKRFVQECQEWLNERRPQLLQVMMAEIEAYRITDRPGEETFQPVC